MLLRKKLGYGLLIVCMVGVVAALVWAALNPAPTPVPTATLTAVPVVSTQTATPPSFNTPLPSTSVEGLKCEGEGILGLQVPFILSTQNYNLAITLLSTRADPNGFAVVSGGQTLRDGDIVADSQGNPVGRVTSIGSDFMVFCFFQY